MTTALSKIATALELLAEDLDAQISAAPVAVTHTQTTKTASSVDLISELYRRHTGEELPDGVRDKLAAADDPELQMVFDKMLKNASFERPTPLGSPSDRHSTNVTPMNSEEAIKLAWDAFEDAIFNGDID
jgi:hypothetical protein